MAVGFIPATAASLLDALLNNSSFAGGANLYVQLHVGDPGAAGTSNVANETDRVAVSFGAASSGTCSNDAAVEWTGVSGSEDYTHLSIWTASSGGTCRATGTMTANAVTAGDNFTIPIGDLDVTLNVAA